MDTEVISYCIGRLPRQYLVQLPHHAPGMNLHRLLPSAEETSYPLLFKPFPYVSSVPIPLTSLTKVPRKALNGIDPTTDLIRGKIKWQMKKERLLKAARNDKKNIGLICWFCLSKKVMKKSLIVGSKALVPQGVLQLAQHLDKDPDPCFAGVYNWYYTGGTLATMKHNDNNYLLYATNCDLYYSRIVDGDRTESSSSLTINDEEPIHEITTNSAGTAVRQKSTVCIMTVDDSDNAMLKLKKTHCVYSENHPFVSVALQERSIQQYSTICNNGSLKLWDIEYSKRFDSGLVIGPGEGVNVTDSWRSLRFLDDRTLLMADRCCLHMLDIREGVKEKQVAWCPKKFTEQCEELSYIVRSCLRDNIVYVATSHQVFCLDLRYGFSQRWTHMMAAPPHLGFTRGMDNDHELVCLGSQILSDCVSVVNTWSGEESQSSFRPSSLPSPAKGLHCARQQGLCLEPTLTQRCTQSMIGLTCLPAENGVHVVRQSATGDVFIQNVSASQEVTRQLTKRELAAYSEWSGHALSPNRDPVTLKVTGVEDFTSVFKAVTNTDIPLEAISETADDSNVNKLPWQISKKYLEDCVDLLAGKMLSVWEVEEEDEWAPDMEAEESLIEQDPTEKVQNWLEAANLEITTFEDKNITREVSTLKPTITSTPFPTYVAEEEVSPIEQPEPFTTLSQPTPAPQLTPTNKQKILSFPSGQFQTPPSSDGSEKRRRKRQKLFDDTPLTTPPKQPASAKKPQSSAKKKFIPGF